MTHDSTPAESVKNNLSRLFATSWAEREQKLTEALMRLPRAAEGMCEVQNKIVTDSAEGLREETSAKEIIPVKQLIPGMARMVLLSLPRTSVRDDEFRRHLETAGEAATRREIEAVKQAAGKLAAALAGLHEPAIEALNLTMPQFGTLETRIRLLKLQADQAEVPALPKNAGRGKKRNRGMKDFVEYVACCYTVAAGEYPTRVTDWETGVAGGPFIDFLQTIFDICGIKASADHKAREVIKAMALNRQKNPGISPLDAFHDTSAKRTP